VALHTDSVAQNCATAEGTGRVNCNNSDTQTSASRFGGQAVDQCAFPCPRRAGDTDTVGVPCVGMHRTHDITEIVVIALNAGEEASQRASVAIQSFFY